MKVDYGTNNSGVDQTGSTALQGICLVLRVADQPWS